MERSEGSSPPIAVYGATGYTGKLIARELERRGAELVLAGRSAEKLDELARELGGEVPTQAAPLDDDAALRELLEPCAAVIACAGPFTLHGEAVLGAAVATGTNYVDTTGEQAFIRDVFDRYDRPAADAGCALVTAMGFDYAPGDALAALTAAGLGALDEITLAYAVRSFRPTRGTTLSGIEMMRGGDVEWRDGEQRTASGEMSAGSWGFEPPIGRQRMLRYPAGEQITVPRHVETRAVRTLLSAATLLPSSLSVAAPIVAAVTPMSAAMIRALSRTPLRDGLGSLVARLPEGPSPAQRRASRFQVECEARAGTRRRRGALRGSDVYGLTSWLAAEAATRMSVPGFDRSGALSPAQAFGAKELLDGAAAVSLQYALDP